MKQEWLICKGIEYEKNAYNTADCSQIIPIQKFWQFYQQCYSLLPRVCDSKEDMKKMWIKIIKTTVEYTEKQLWQVFARNCAWSERKWCLRILSFDSDSLNIRLHGYKIFFVCGFYFRNNLKSASGAESKGQIIFGIKTDCFISKETLLKFEQNIGLRLQWALTALSQRYFYSLLGQSVFILYKIYLLSLQFKIKFLSSLYSSDLGHLLY